MPSTSLSRPVLAAMVASTLTASVWAAPAHADEAAIKAELNAAQTALQDAFRDNDPQKIRAAFTDDHQAVTPYYGRFMTPQKQLETLSEFSFTFTFLSEPQISLVSDDAAVVTYVMSYNGTFDGEAMPPKVAVSEVWVKDGERWLQRLYQETAVK